MDRARREWQIRGEAPEARAHGRAGRETARGPRRAFEGKTYDL
jgi:hypothetical protein